MDSSVTPGQKDIERTVVTHVSSAHPWTDNRIHFRECLTLTNLGYEVHLVAVESAVKDVPKTEVIVTALPMLPRIPRVTIGTWRAIRRALKTKASVYHLHDPELVWAVPVLRALRKRVIFDAHEDLPVQVVSKEYIRPFFKPFMIASAHLAVGLARMSNQVIAATEKIAERFPKERVSIVHNYPPLLDSEIDPAPVGDRRKALVYVGGIGAARGAQPMVDALADPVFPSDWVLEAAGSVSAPLLEKLESSPGWQRVSYHGLLNPTAARQLVLDARVGLLLYQDNAAHRDALPTKMFEYFAAGVPVVASDFPLWRSIVEKFDCGILVDETSPHAIAAAVARYEEETGLLQRHSENARRLALEQLNWAHEEPILAVVYERALA